MRTIAASLVAFVLMTGGARPAAAQGAGGGIAGAIADGQGAALPGATVSLLNEGTNAQLNTVTNDEGA